MYDPSQITQSHTAERLTKEEKFNSNQLCYTLFSFIHQFSFSSFFSVCIGSFPVLVFSCIALFRNFRIDLCTVFFVLFTISFFFISNSQLFYRRMCRVQYFFNGNAFFVFCCVPFIFFLMVRSLKWFDGDSICFFIFFRFVFSFFPLFFLLLSVDLFLSLSA